MFNGASMLEEALDNLRNQSLKDLEIIISDNASTDKSPQIIAKAIASDPRVRAVRQPSNLGPLPNFRFVLEQATTPYFAWRSYDDLTTLDYFERLAAKLDKVPEAVLAAPHVNTLRVHSGKRRPRPVVHLQGGAPPAWRILRNAQAGWIYGLWRTDALKAAFDWSVPAITPHIWGWDHLCLFPAILQGKVVFDDAACLTLRLNHAITKESGPDDRERSRDLAQRYIDACDKLISDELRSSIDRLRMRLALRLHVHRRISSLSARF